jgi:phosphopantothenoylcysteine decarboxylase/phosphopantothenate--cysteine ligase
MGVTGAFTALCSRHMNCVVTAGPTYETLDNVRRLTNFSTGRLGSELANFLTEHGHQVTLLLGEQATYAGELRAQAVERFTTTADLGGRLRALGGKVGAVFHAAAVSDFKFGKVWVRAPEGAMTEIKSGKISTRSGTLLAELVPTPKLIAELRGWHPGARLVGWKFEVDGDRTAAIASGARQLADCQTDACVVNGPAYGEGFGLIQEARKCTHVPNRDALFNALLGLIAD